MSTLEAFLFIIGYVLGAAALIGAIAFLIVGHMPEGSDPYE